MVDPGSLEGGAKGLADLLTMRGIEVESISELSKGFENLVTALIIDIKPHPQADRLSLCTVDANREAPLEIVCGAKNMKNGDKVVLALTGANLPNGMKITENK